MCLSATAGREQYMKKNNCTKIEATNQPTDKLGLHEND